MGSNPTRSAKKTRAHRALYFFDMRGFEGLRGKKASKSIRLIAFGFGLKEVQNAFHNRGRGVFCRKFQMAIDVCRGLNIRMFVYG